MSLCQGWNKGEKELHLFSVFPIPHVLPVAPASKAFWQSPLPLVTTLSPGQLGTVSSSLPQSPPILTALHQSHSICIYCQALGRLSLSPLLCNSVQGNSCQHVAELQRLCPSGVPGPPTWAPPPRRAGAEGRALVRLGCLSRKADFSNPPPAAWRVQPSLQRLRSCCS